MSAPLVPGRLVQTSFLEVCDLSKGQSLGERGSARGARERPASFPSGNRRPPTTGCAPARLSPLPGARQKSTWGGKGYRKEKVPDTFPLARIAITVCPSRPQAKALAGPYTGADTSNNAARILLPQPRAGPPEGSGRCGVHRREPSAGRGEKGGREKVVGYLFLRQRKPWPSR